MMIGPAQYELSFVRKQLVNQVGNHDRIISDVFYIERIPIAFEIAFGY